MKHTLDLEGIADATLAARLFEVAQCISYDHTQTWSSISRTAKLFVVLRDGLGCRECGYTTMPRPRRRYLDLQTTVDHIIPRSKGGGHEPSNLRILCLGCNSRKSDRERYGCELSARRL